MKHKLIPLFGCFVLTVADGVPLGTAFTYQGRLEDDGQPANGIYQLKFITATSA